MPIKINGATSGSTTITAPATGSDESIELSTALASKLDLAGGKILQIVRATDAGNRTTTSTSYVDVTGMSITITPQKSDSAVIVLATGRFYTSGDGTLGKDYIADYAITDSSNNQISGAEDVRIGPEKYAYSGNVIFNAGGAVLIAYATPATTSAVTYKLRFKVNAANVGTGIAGTVTTSQMYAIEVSA